MNDLVIVRGGGDLATGIVQKLYRAGIRILILEVEQPTCIRRNVSLSDAVYEGLIKVEDMTCRLIHNAEQMDECHRGGEIPLMVDREGACIQRLKPQGVVDAIIAKKNLGTNRGMAPITIAAGPGFCAGEDVDIVVETLRGHDLGRLIMSGRAKPNTGIPGEIGGKSAERVIHAAESGIIKHCKKIGDLVEKGDILFYVDGIPMTAPFDGLLRGLIREGLCVPKGMKAADIDPRTDVDYNTISDKARCIGGGVLEAYFYLKNRLEHIR